MSALSFEMSMSSTTWVAPESKQVMLCVQGELDELEREEFFRLKKVQAKKKRDAADKDQAVIQVRHCDVR